MRRITQPVLNGVRFCSKCGAKIFLQGYNEQNRFAATMQRKKICYDCAFWADLIDYPPANLQVLGITCLKIYPPGDKKDKSIILGGKGKKRYFLGYDGSVIFTNDLWIIGTIPERFRPFLSPTVVEISERAYNQLSRNCKVCKARGCLDRYNCFRYDIGLEEAQPPANNIPKTWKEGDEHCRWYLRHSDIQSDERSLKSFTQ